MLEQAATEAEGRGLVGKASLPVLAKAFSRFLRGKVRANEDMEW